MSNHDIEPNMEFSADYPEPLGYKKGVSFYTKKQSELLANKKLAGSIVLNRKKIYSLPVIDEIEGHRVYTIAPTDFKFRGFIPLFNEDGTENGEYYEVGVQRDYVKIFFEIIPILFVIFYAVF